VVVNVILAMHDEFYKCSYMFFIFVGTDDGADINRDILVGIYERIKANAFQPGSDHVTEVMRVQSTIVGVKPVSNLHLKLQISAIGH
jgi:hypothetical protein